MPDVLHRITYDATIDEAVDVGLRLANRTHAFCKQIRQNVIASGVAAGLAFVALWFYIGGGRTIWELVVSVAGGTVFGFMFAVMFRRFFEKEIRRQQRKIVGEQFGGKNTIQSEIACYGPAKAGHYVLWL